MNELRQVKEALQRLNRELRAIANCNQALLRATDEQSLLEDICRIVCEEAGYRMVWVGYAEHDAAKSVRPVAWFGVEEGYLRTVRITWSDAERGRGPGGTCIRTGETVCAQDFTADPRTAPWHASARKRGYRSTIALPLKDDRDQPFAALIIYADELNAFSAEEQHLLEQLAGDLAFGIVAIRTRLERAQAQESLRASEERYRTLVETIPDFIVRYDRDLRRTYVNPVWVEVSGLAASEVVGVRATEIPRVPRPANRKYLVALRRVLRTGCRERVEFTWVNARGQALRLDYVVVPDTDARGEVIGVLAVGRDVTKERLAQERLAAAASEWRTTFDAMRDSVSLLDTDGRVVRCNAATGELTGRSNEEILDRFCFEVFHGGDTWHAACPQIKARDSRHSETAIFEQDGRWLQATYQPLLEEGQPAGGVHVVRDITELKQTEQELQASLGKLTTITEEVIAAIAGIVEMRDPYTAGHERRVSELATAIAERMGLDDDTVTGVRVAALLHDVGKITVPAEILTKPGQLVPLEFELIKQHPQVAYDMLHGIQLPWPVALVALQHHERLDGSGYPQGLRGEQIVLEARILAVADVVEAMASHRPYRPACGIEAALDEIRSNRGRLYDAVAADACVQVFATGGFAFDQRLPM